MMVLRAGGDGFKQAALAARGGRCRARRWGSVDRLLMMFVFRTRVLALWVSPPGSPAVLLEEKKNTQLTAHRLK